MPARMAKLKKSRPRFKDDDTLAVVLGRFASRPRFFDYPEESNGKLQSGKLVQAKDFIRALFEAVPSGVFTPRTLKGAFIKVRIEKMKKGLAG